MENIGYYLNHLKEWFKEGWELFFKDPKKLQSHHLLAFLITVIILHILSFLVSKIFKTLVRLCIMIALLWLLWMLLFDRKKYNELFEKTKNNICDDCKNNLEN